MELKAELGSVAEPHWDMDDAGVAGVFAAVERQDAAALRALLSERPSLALARDAAGDQPLHRCARGPPDLAAPWQGPAEQVAELLLASGADANAVGSDGAAPLALAVRAGAHGLVRLLLEAGADLGHARQDTGATALMAAACSKDAVMCRLLLEARADASQQDSLGRTAADLARREGSAGCTALLRASAASRQAALAPAQDRAVDVHVISVGGDTVSQLRLPPSGTAGQVKQRVYEEHGTPPHQQRLACGDEVLSNSRLLVALPQPLTLTLVVIAPDPETNDDLVDAAEDGEVEAVKQALCASADPNHVDEEGWTPLAVAATHGHAEIVRILCEAGADKACTSNPGGGATPIFLAVNGGHGEVVRFLSQAGANLDVALHVGVTPLHAAVAANLTELIQLLCEGKADVGKARWDGKTPLHLASQQGHEEAARLLCQWGAPLDARARGGETPLLAAVEGGHLEVASCLLGAGADADRGARDGSTPMEVAVRRGFIEIVRLLSEAGADPGFLPPQHQEMLRMASQGLGCMC